MVGHYWSDGRKAWIDVEVHQASVEFGDGRAVFPADSGVQGEAGTHAPVIGDVGVVDRCAKVLVGVAESDGAGVRDAQKKVGERRTGSAVRVRLGGRAGEGKSAARVLLREQIVLLAAKIGAERDVVAAAIPDEVVRDLVGLIASQG